MILLERYSHHKVIYDGTLLVCMFSTISVSNFWTRPCFAKRKILLNFNLQLVSPMKPCNVKGFAVFLESNMSVKVKESLSDLSVAQHVDIIDSYH